MREELNRLLELEPFKAFRVILSSGHEYEVRNPMMLVVMQDVAMLANPRSDRYSVLRLVQVAALDIIE